MGKKKQNEIVKKSNLLVRSPWTVTSIWEPRLVGVLASKIHVDDEDFKIYRVSMKELVEGAGQERWGKVYREIEEAVEKMMRYPLKLYGEDGSVTICSIFAQCKIIPKEGAIELCFAEALKPHYLQLKERFTRYMLEEFMKLPSIYSQRLFEILSSWRNLKEGEVIISMEKLHEQLETPPSQRKNFKEFRIYVLEKAHDDITKDEKTKTSLDYEWEAVKKEGGRKVVAVRFVFDKGKISAIRRAREKEAWKERELRPLAEKCSQSMSANSESEQDRIQREQKQNVCDFCNAAGIAKKNLFPLTCKRYAKIEVLNEDGNPMTMFEPEPKISEPIREPEKTAETRVVEAYLRMTNGKFDEVRFISAVHHYLPDITREELNKTLLRMQREKMCVLDGYNIAALKKEDKENPVMVGEKPCHTIYIERSK